MSERFDRARILKLGAQEHLPRGLTCGCMPGQSPVDRFLQSVTMSNMHLEPCYSVVFEARIDLFKVYDKRSHNR